MQKQFTKDAGIGLLRSTNRRTPYSLDLPASLHFSTSLKTKISAYPWVGTLSETRNQDSNQALEIDPDELESVSSEWRRWVGVVKHDLGIGTLRHRLSEVLFEQISKELPAMIWRLRGHSRKPGKSCNAAFTNALLSQINTQHETTPSATMQGNHIHRRARFLQLGHQKYLRRCNIVSFLAKCHQNVAEICQARATAPPSIAVMIMSA